jgi:RHS repeat-associated protein
MKLGIRILDLGFSKKQKKQDEISVSSVAPCENKKKYEAFGNIVWEEGIHEDNREFTGKEKEPTGFHYFGARRYYANIGRFLSPDPHTLMPGGFELTDPQTLNPYVYCTNDPVNLYDPDGRTSYAVYATQLTIDYAYNEHLLQQYYSLYDGCPSCGAGASAKFFPPDNPLGYKLGMACFSHDAAGATEGISWVRASSIFGMALLDAITGQTDNSIQYVYSLDLGVIYWLGGTAAFPAYLASQRDFQYTIENGKLKIIKKKEEEEEDDNDASGDQKNGIKRFDSHGSGMGDYYYNTGYYFDPKLHNAGSCEDW